MRGKHIEFDFDAEWAGITPAHAGKTCPAVKAAAACKDHPRACGENRSHSRGCENIDGSPPRMRGKLFAVSGFFAAPGITPAHAGKTHICVSGSGIT